MQRGQSSHGEAIDSHKAGTLTFAIVVARFNQDITEPLRQGAFDLLIKQGVPKKQIETFYVPGAFELPLACKKIALQKRFAGIVALGCIIKGETDHYYYIAGEASRGIMQVMLDCEIPIGFGVLTATNLQQAIERSKGASNKGKEAAQAMLEMIW
jgi:6,7-dimethyl-8-ribityllumazine synthase